MKDPLVTLWEATIKTHIAAILEMEFVALVPGKHVPLQTSAPVTYNGLRTIFELGFNSGQISPRREPPA